MIQIDLGKRVALAGNPNTGKTTVFNRLTGGNAKVGNYPGVTVERQEGTMKLEDGAAVRLLDVPGTYSLSARSAEEQIALQAVAGLHPLERPDLVLIVVDATQLARNLYLVLQVIETGLPVVVALNMIDAQEEAGLSIDVAAIESELGVPVVPTAAKSGRGLRELREAVRAVLADPQRGRPGPRWRPETESLREDVRAVGAVLPADWHRGDADRRDALAMWALLSLDEEDELEHVPTELRTASSARHRAAEAAGRDLDLEIVEGRYAWIDERLPRFLGQPRRVRVSKTDRIDAVLLNPVVGFVAFLALMGVVFQSLFAWSDPAIGAIESLFGWLQGLVESALPAGLLVDFVTGGLIEGVGSVVVFLPQILLLFFFIGLMEDTGYMSRVAYLMDRVMRALGLHGRAFVPMMSGFACAIPAILATRTMERRRDRFLTMMVVPLMTCSARLPVYTLVIAALFPPTDVFGFLPVQGLLMVAMYVFSVVVALAAAWVLGRTVLRGPRVPLLLEMPTYRLPHWPSVLRMMWTRTRAFLTEAGTVILVCTIGMWLLLTFPRDPQLAGDYDARAAAVAAAELPEEARDEALAAIQAARGAERLQRSYGGRLGHLIEPAIEPLGFDWKIGVGLIGAFAAREVFVSTMGVVYGFGEDTDEESPSLREKIRSETREDGRPVYSPLVGLSLMVFFALACQCMSTLAVVRRETRTWRWPLFLFAYMTVLAWLASFAVFQGGKLLGFE